MFTMSRYSIVRTLVHSYTRTLVHSYTRTLVLLALLSAPAVAIETGGFQQDPKKLFGNSSFSPGDST